MAQSVLILSAFFVFAILMWLLALKQLLTLRFAIVGVLLGSSGSLAALVVPRTHLINDTLGISPTGALLALFGATVAALIVLLATVVNRLRVVQDRLVTELALLGRRIDELERFGSHGESPRSDHG